MGDLIDIHTGEHLHELSRPRFLDERQTPAPSQRSCEDCEHAMFGQSGTFCRHYQVDVIDLNEARECEEYTPVPWATETGARYVES